jgi:small-conductance mechanosensitive channel/CRP-like cAMP-binding protein
VTASIVLDLPSLGLALGCAVVAVLCVAVGRARQRQPAILLGISTTGLLLALSMAVDRFGTAPSPLMIDGLGRGFVSLALLALAFTLNALLDRFVWFGRLREGGHSRVPRILIAMTRLGMYAGALTLSATAIFHRDVTAIAATSGVVAIVLGYSLQPTLAEIFAGLALSLSQPFRVGDSIQIDGIWGVVHEANWRSVSLRTYEGTLVVMPNSKVASLRLANLDQPDHNLRHHIRFVVDIDIAPGLVKSVALAAMKAQPHVLPAPEPLLLFKDMTEHGAAYEAIFWHADPNLYILRRDEIGAALWYAFRRAGIPFSVLRRGLAPSALSIPVVPPEDAARHDERLGEALRRSPLFRCFSDEAIGTLVGQQRPLTFGPGERVMRQGDPGSSMFIILDGEVAVFLENAEAVEQRIATLGPGETFGHMSLMTGAPRSATVRALCHLVAAEIEKPALAPLLDANPNAVDAIAQEIIALESANRLAREIERGEAPSAEPAGLLDRLVGLSSLIRGFFRLRD